MSELTPMMRQYRALKDQHPQAILLFRLGDFFEAFFDDAHLVARELQLTLTSRPVAKGRRIPMCGIPHHALHAYLRRLIDRGHRVAICDQVEDPKQARTLVRRGVAEGTAAPSPPRAHAPPDRRHGPRRSDPAGACPRGAPAGRPRPGPAPRRARPRRNADGRPPAPPLDAAAAPRS